MKTFSHSLPATLTALLTLSLTSITLAQDGDSAKGDAAKDGADTTAADTPAASPAEKVNHSSIIDLSPQPLFQAQRYPRLFGDPNLNRDTIDGGILGRQYLLGSLGGARRSLVEHGFFTSLGLTQVLQGVVSGDSDDDVNYMGSADLWLGLDTGRAGLWPDGLVFAHLEGNWGDPVSGTGALLPLNSDSIQPTAPSALALSETPAVHLSLDAQYIKPFGSDRDDIFVLGTRLQIDF